MRIFTLPQRLRELQKFHMFSSHISRKEHAEALELFPKINIGNGRQQIAIAKHATLLLRLGNFVAADAEFQRAIDSELSWGKRRPEDNSRYIVAYCEFYKMEARRRSKCEHYGEDVRQRLVILDLMPVSKNLKRYDLPLPDQY